MKDNNRSVNDIFQNDNSSKNKTKTILLLTIVAIILISVFLIIAWVMTRDNPLQDMQKEHEQTLNNQTKERPLPYAHNMENENPFGIDTSKNIPPRNEDSSLPDTAMSNTPPIGVPTDNNLALATENKDAEKNNEFERDEKYQAVLKDLEKQHADKKNTEAKKETESQKAKEQAQTKVVMPPVPKETIIAPALDPTKSTQKAKDSDKQAQKIAPKEQAKLAEAKKPNTQTTQANTTQKPKDSEKPNIKPQEKQNSQEKPNTSATPQKLESKEQDNKVMQRPQNNIVSANQGKAPEKGHYVQVGAFTDQDKITPEFLNKISKYNYRILKVEQNGVKSAKYLIGPYKTREEVKQIETKIRTEINQGAFYVDRTK